MKGSFFCFCLGPYHSERVNGFKKLLKSGKKNFHTFFYNFQSNWIWKQPLKFWCLHRFGSVEAPWITYLQDRLIGSQKIYNFLYYSFIHFNYFLIILFTPLTTKYMKKIIKTITICGRKYIIDDSNKMFVVQRWGLQENWKPYYSMPESIVPEGKMQILLLCFFSLTLA